MSLSKVGSNYDNDLANALNDATDENIRASSMRGSGNTGYPECDVLLRTPKVDHAIEAKKKFWDTGDRGLYINEEDLEQLWQCKNVYTKVWLAIKFSRRELLFIPAENPTVIMDAISDAFNVSYTGGGNLRGVKPDTDMWPSTQSGKEDVDVILSRLGLQ